MSSRGARILNIALGAWLFISTFLWRHSAPQATVTWITGLVIVAVALIALTTPAVRYLNVALGIWLIISAFSFAHIARATVWNNTLVGIVVALVALVGPVESGAGFRRQARVPT
jgi:hypothetical protein